MHAANMPTPRITKRMNMPDMSPNEIDSVLSDPDRTHSFNRTEDEIVMRGQGSTRVPKMPGGRLIFEVNADEMMENALKEPSGSRCLKRKLTATVNDLSKRELEPAHPTASERSPSPTCTKKLKLNRQRLHGPEARGFRLGILIGSSAPDDEQKHAVIGFIDVSGRPQTRIQPITKHGELLAESYPFPHLGRGWVAFNQIIFSDHLVGLNYLQVKEYIRIRSETATEGVEDGSVAAEHAAVEEAIRRVKEDPTLRDPRLLLDPLPGTRPTHILIGHWKPSSEVDPEDRRAAYGVLGENESFRVKVVRQTRERRFLDGSYPSAPSIRWVYSDKIEFESHLKGLNRQGLKEYCRVRQYQLDQGETSAERIENETKAVYEAQLRTGTTPHRQHQNVTVPAFTVSSEGDDNERLNGRYTL